MEISLQSSQPDSSYRIIQFRESTSENYREKLEEKSLQFLYYVPENAWVINSSEDRGEIVSEKKVRYVGLFRPEYRISSNVEKRLDKKDEVSVRLSFFSRPEEKVLDRFDVKTSDSGGLTLHTKVNSSEVTELAEVDEVRRISLQRPELETFNDLSRDLIQADRLQEIPFDFTGEGFTAAIWDQGLAGEHRDLNYTGKRIVGNTGIDVLGHATHVAGTMLGGGKLDNSYRGVAPDARFVTYRWPDGDNFIQDILTETEDSSSYGSVVSQNSWGYGVDGGCELMGGYFEASSTYDNITHGTADQEKMLFVFSAGNQRSDQSCGGEGYTYNTTTGPGATAKNTLAVGAVDDSAGMTSYSSWGPTDDGRLKPEVVADGGCGLGTQINSTLPGNNYGSKCGTSMASPAVSGTVILLNQQFNRTYDRIPDPATVKGLIVHNAEDLNTTGPDYRTGYGLVNATETIEYVKESQRQGLIKKDFVSVDETRNYTVNITGNGSAKFTLAWSDYPGTSSSGKALVNDLDLKVWNSSGHRFYPWTLNWSQRKGSAERIRQDRKNNLVQVYIPNISSEKLNISVHGESVPQGPQSYSLMMTEKKWLVPEITVESPQNRSYDGSPDFNFSSDMELDDAKFSIDNGENQSMENSSGKHFYNTTTSIEEGRHNITFYAYQKAWTNRTEYFTVDKTEPGLNPLGPLDQANISGQVKVNATWNDTLSSINRSEYRITNNGGFEAVGDLNTSFNSSETGDGEYNLTYFVQDSAGNSINQTVNVTIDNTPPEFSNYSPQRKAVNKDFTVNASWKEDETGVKNAYYRLENSSDTWQGSFNDSINFSEFENGNYTLKFVLEDYAENRKIKTNSLALDSQRPSLKVEKPVNGSYVSQSFSVEASFEDNLSGVESANYSLTNGTEVSTEELNGSVSNQELEEGIYNITFNVKDFAGNTVEKRINVTLDSTKPDINFQRPEDGALISENFSVNASASDDFSGVETKVFRIENRSGTQISDDLNKTVNSSQLNDGNYSISAEITDKAGNVRKVTREIDIDNQPPALRSSSVKEEANLSGEVDIRAEFEEVSEFNSSFRFANSSGNVTGWEGLNYSDFNSSELENGNYNLSLRANDSLGHSETYSITGITVDNQVPEIEIVSGSSEKFNGWVKDSQTVDFTCTDQISEVRNISVSTGSESQTSNSSSENLELDQPGNNSYMFSCQDFAGNTVTEERFYSIDSKKPEITALNPEEGSLTNLNFTLNIDFRDESDRSGIDTAESDLNIQDAEGEVTSTRWTNNSVTAEITGMDPSTDFTVEGQILDNLGHKENIQASYSTISLSQSTTQTLPSTAGNTSDNQTTPEEKFEVTEKGLSVQNFGLNEGETRDINVSNYTENLLSDIRILGASEGSTDLTVETLEAPENVSEGLSANRYLRIDVENDSLVENARVRFHVKKSWIKDENVDPETIKLYRIDGGWNGLETVMIGNYSGRYLFQVNLDGFSNFSIAGQKSCGEEVSAVSPGETSCQTYVSSCEKPDEWQTVESCSVWSEKQRAQQALKNLSEQDVDQEKIDTVRQQVNEGNYSGAIQQAENIQKTESSENAENSGNIVLTVLIGVLIFSTLIGSGYIGLIYYRRRKLEEEINRIGEKLMEQTGEEKLNKYTTMTDKVIQAKKALQMNEYRRARQEINQYSEEAEKRGLDVPKPDLIDPINSFDYFKQTFSS